MVNAWSIVCLREKDKNTKKLGLRTCELFGAFVCRFVCDFDCFSCFCYFLVRLLFCVAYRIVHDIEIDPKT